jgi:hypothetical protein
MKPILFNTEMVKAILERRKTTTRRIIKLPKCGYFEIEPPRVKEPYIVGDILYVRETWSILDGRYIYKADDPSPAGWHQTSWHPSIHMPKKAARLFLRVTNVRVARLQDISNEDIINEGVRTGVVKHYENQMPYEESENVRYAHEIAFTDLWNSTIKTGDYDLYSWEANPWVWVIEFERISKEEAYGKS